LVQEAWTRLQFDDAISIEPFQSFVDHARLVGFLREEIDLSELLWNPR
jgi:hypothetical protein